MVPAMYQQAKPFLCDARNTRLELVNIPLSYGKEFEFDSSSGKVSKTKASWPTGLQLSDLTRCFGRILQKIFFSDYMKRNSPSCRFDPFSESGSARPDELAFPMYM